MLNPSLIICCAISGYYICIFQRLFPFPYLLETLQILETPTLSYAAHGSHATYKTKGRECGPVSVHQWTMHDRGCHPKQGHNLS